MKENLVKRYPCKVCDGTGSYEREEPMYSGAMGGPTHWVHGTCRTCKGTGIDLLQAVSDMEIRLSTLEGQKDH